MSIIGWTLLVSYSRRCERRKPARAASCSWCCRPRPGQRARKPAGQAARLRSGRGLQPSVSLRALQAVASLLGEMLDMFTPGSPHPMSRPAPARAADPFSLERARAIDAKAEHTVVGGDAARRRVGDGPAAGARAGCGGLLAALGQYQELGGLRRSWEPFCASTARTVSCRR